MSFYYLLKQKLQDKAILEEHLDYTPQFEIASKSQKENNTNALAMRMADPLWVLGRQWQFGEFVGEDNGSPISVNVRYRKEKVSQYSTNKEPKSLHGIPLEAQIEATTIPAIDLKSKVRIGQQYERLIKKALGTAAIDIIEDLRKQFALSHELWQDHELKKASKMDEKSNRFFRLMKGKVIDGGQLVKHLEAVGFTYPLYGENASFSSLEDVTQQFKIWWKNFWVQPQKNQQAWQDKHLAYQFKLHAKDIELNAPDYQSGHLDWYSFDNSTIGIDPTQDNDTLLNQVPVNVSFPSMPDKRLFSFEDSHIDLSQMDVQTSDLLKLILVDFALVSGGDWYTIPIPMELGELCWVSEIEVKDVFGVSTIIEHNKELHQSALKVWDAFKVRDKLATTYDLKDHFLFLAPATSHKMESKPQEELLFLRDEYANMVWAIEKKVPNAMGNPVDGFDLHLELYGPFQTPDAAKDSTEETIPTYRLASTVPSHWIPYLPKHEAGQNKDILLQRAYMVRNDNDNNTEPTDLQPLTHLAEQAIRSVREEAIPRAGVRVQLTKQRIRWTDGKTYLWQGYKVLVGRGEGNSGLRFDYLEG